MILTPIQKLPNNVGNLGKIIFATGFDWWPKVQKIAESGHTEGEFLKQQCSGDFKRCRGAALAAMRVSSSTATYSIKRFFIVIKSQFVLI